MRMASPLASAARRLVAGGDAREPEDRGEAGGGEGELQPGPVGELPDRDREGERHHGDGDTLDASRDAAVQPPFADQRAEGGVVGEPVVEARRGAGVAGGGHQHEGRGRQAGDDDADQAQQQGEAAGDPQQQAHRRRGVQGDGLVVRVGVRVRVHGAAFTA